MSHISQKEDQDMKNVKWVAVPVLLVCIVRFEDDLPEPDNFTRFPVEALDNSSTGVTGSVS